MGWRKIERYLNAEKKTFSIKDFIELAALGNRNVRDFISYIIGHSEPNISETRRQISNYLESLDFSTRRKLMTSVFNDKNENNKALIELVFKASNLNKTAIRDLSKFISRVNP